MDLHRIEGESVNVIRAVVIEMMESANLAILSLYRFISIIVRAY